MSRLLRVGMERPGGPSGTDRLGTYCLKAKSRFDPFEEGKKGSDPFFFGQGPDEPLPILIIAYNALASVAPRGDMIDCACIGYSKGSGHNGVVLGPMCKVKT